VPEAEHVRGNVEKIAVVQAFSQEQWDDGMPLGAIIQARLAEAMDAAVARHFRLQEMTPDELAAWQDEQDRRTEARIALDREARLTAAEDEMRRCPACHHHPDDCDPDDGGW
jgi:hypothetical protein